MQSAASSSQPSQSHRRRRGERAARGPAPPGGAGAAAPQRAAGAKPRAGRGGAPGAAREQGLESGRPQSAPRRAGCRQPHRARSKEQRTAPPATAQEPGRGHGLRSSARLQQQQAAGSLSLLAAACGRRASLAECLPDPLPRSVLAACDEEGRSPLALVVHSGCPEQVPLLAKAKASLESTDFQGNTPLMLAAFLNKRMMVAELLEVKANAGRRNKDGKRAYDLAVSGAVRSLLMGPTVGSIARASTDASGTFRREDCGIVHRQ